MRHVFLDFEASSLSDRSHPIEVGWADESGAGESHLIRPTSAWQDWSAKSEQIHGISRDRLQREGRDADLVAARIVEALGGPGIAVHSDACEFDQAWMNELLVAGGWRPGLIRVLDIADAFAFACLPLEEAGLADAALFQCKRGIIDAVKSAEKATTRTRHRALDDAEAMLWTWREVQRMASAVASNLDPDGPRHRA